PDGQGPPPPDVTVLGGLALDPKGAELLSGRWGGRLDRSLLIRSAREVAAELVARIATTRPGPAAGPPPPVPPPPGAQTAPGVACGPGGAYGPGPSDAVSSTPTPSP